jgi:hypothetical protein
MGARAPLQNSPRESACKRRQTRRRHIPMRHRLLLPSGTITLIFASHHDYTQFDCFLRSITNMPAGISVSKKVDSGPPPPPSRTASASNSSSSSSGVDKLRSLGISISGGAGQSTASSGPARPEPARDPEAAAAGNSLSKLEQLNLSIAPAASTPQSEYPLYT